MGKFYNLHWNKINPVKACDRCDRLIWNKWDTHDAGEYVYYHTGCLPDQGQLDHDAADYSEDNPLGGSIEPYDIYIEMELTD